MHVVAYTKTFLKISYNINFLSYQQDKYYKIWTFLKKICIFFQNFPKNVINDLQGRQTEGLGGGLQPLLNFGEGGSTPNFERTCLIAHLGLFLIA